MPPPAPLSLSPPGAVLVVTGAVVVVTTLDELDDALELAVLPAVLLDEVDCAV